MPHMSHLNHLKYQDDLVAMHEHVRVQKQLIWCYLNERAENQVNVRFRDPRERVYWLIESIPMPFHVDLCLDGGVRCFE